MGGTSWSDDHYHDRIRARKTSGTPDFAYSAAINSGSAAAKVHDTLDPKRVAGPKSPFAGKVMRECRDSDAHPVSNAVAVFLDVTGSMRQVPVILQKNLVKLMGLLLRKSYLSDPAILIGAVGDFHSDKAPMQMGQFESGIEIENDLTNLYLEGGGGGQDMESYELALYALARKTVIDCFEKRQKKGYAFIIGDERAYPTVERRAVKELFGDDLEADIPLADIVVEVQQKYDLYFIMPNMTNHFGESKMLDFWRSLLGQNFIMLDDPEGISELLATIIGVGEGVADPGAVEADLVDVGTAKNTAGAVSRSLATVGKAKSDIATVAGTGLESV